MEQVGCIVPTPYGKGKVVEYREKDETHIIFISFGILYKKKESSFSFDGASFRKPGTKVQTPYGEGRVLQYRETDQVCVVKLSFGVLYMDEMTVLGELNIPTDVKSVKKLTGNAEAARRELLHNERKRTAKCTKCCSVLAARKVPAHWMERQKPRQGPPCLLCGYPCCTVHSCGIFRKEGITVCEECKKLFSLKFVMDLLTFQSSEAKNQKICQMIEIYDRALTLLKYSSDLVDDIAASLQGMKTSRDHIFLGCSSVGFVSGALGVAAAITLLTPVSPFVTPSLAAAAFVTSGSSTAVTTHVQLNHHYSDANQLANRVIALHAMCKCIVRIRTILKHALVKQQVKRAMQELDEENKTPSIPDNEQTTPSEEPTTDQNNEEDTTLQEEGSAIVSPEVDSLTRVMRMLVRANIEASTDDKAEKAKAIRDASLLSAADLMGIVAQAEKDENSATTSRYARFLSRSCANAISSLGNVTQSLQSAMDFVGAAQFTGGTMSAAVLIYEAKSIAKLLDSIRKKESCDKASMLQKVKGDINQMPSCLELQEDCQCYIDMLDEDPYKFTDDDINEILMEILVDMPIEGGSLDSSEESEESEDKVNDGGTIKTINGTTDQLAGAQKRTVDFFRRWVEMDKTTEKQTDEKCNHGDAAQEGEPTDASNSPFLNDASNSPFLNDVSSRTLELSRLLGNYATSLSPPKKKKNNSSSTDNAGDTKPVDVHQNEKVLHEQKEKEQAEQGNAPVPVPLWNRFRSTREGARIAPVEDANPGGDGPAKESTLCDAHDNYNSTGEKVLIPKINNPTVLFQKWSLGYGRQETCNDASDALNSGEKVPNVEILNDAAGSPDDASADDHKEKERKLKKSNQAGAFQLWAPTFGRRDPKRDAVKITREEKTVSSGGILKNEKETVEDDLCAAPANGTNLDDNVDDCNKVVAQKNKEGNLLGLWTQSMGRSDRVSG